MKKIKCLSLAMIMAFMLTGCGGNGTLNNESKDESTPTNDKVNIDYYSEVKEVYFNPITGQKCNDYIEENSINENKSGCMKWYVFSENSDDTVNMILDHNTTYKVSWTQKENNLNGPDEALKQLKDDTKDWAGVPTRHDNYKNTGKYKEQVNDNEWVEKEREYAISYDGYKARLITAQELALVTGNKDWKETGTTTHFYFGSESDSDFQNYSNRGNYSWLYNYTYGCKDKDCDIEDDNTYGYWTASALYKDLAFVVHFGGMVYNEKVTSQKGIRPVITIDKSLVE